MKPLEILIKVLIIFLIGFPILTVSASFFDDRALPIEKGSSFRRPASDSLYGNFNDGFIQRSDSDFDSDNIKLCFSIDKIIEEDLVSKNNWEPSLREKIIFYFQNSEISWNTFWEHFWGGPRSFGENSWKTWNESIMTEGVFIMTEFNKRAHMNFATFSPPEFGLKEYSMRSEPLVVLPQVGRIGLPPNQATKYFGSSLWVERAYYISAPRVGILMYGSLGHILVFACFNQETMKQYEFRSITLDQAAKNDIAQVLENWDSPMELSKKKYEIYTQLIHKHFENIFKKNEMKDATTLFAEVSAVAAFGGIVTRRLLLRGLSKIPQGQAAVLWFLPYFQSFPRESPPSINSCSKISLLDFKSFQINYETAQDIYRDESFKECLGEIEKFDSYQVLKKLGQCEDLTLDCS